MRNRNILRVELIGSTSCRCGDITVTGATPLLMLCRKLVEAGHNPDSGLEAWRVGAFCLRISSIGEAAGLQTGGDGVGFRPISKPARASPVRSNDIADIQLGHRYDTPLTTAYPGEELRPIPSIAK